MKWGKYVKNQSPWMIPAVPTVLTNRRERTSRGILNEQGKNSSVTNQHCSTTESIYQRNNNRNNSQNGKDQPLGELFQHGEEFTF
jgi:hypothetical protein